MNSTPTLTQEWDKTFPQNEAVDHCKVTFHNRFGIEPPPISTSRRARRAPSPPWP